MPSCSRDCRAGVKAVAAADHSMTGGSSSAPAADPSAAKKSNEMKLMELIRRINLQEVPENDAWLRLGQLTYAHEQEGAMDGLMDTFLRRAHPLVDPQKGRFDPEYERYRVMTMLPYARVVRVSGSSAVEGNLALTSSMLRRCMTYQAEPLDGLDGGHRWVEGSVWQVLGEKRALTLCLLGEAPVRCEWTECLAEMPPHRYSD